MTSTLAIVQQVALYLGKPWKFSHLGEPSDWRYEITDGTGHVLNFHVNSYQHKGKLRVSGNFPRSRTAPYRTDYKTIGISISRPPRDIAADITRRLIPQYLAAYDRAEEAYKEQHQKAENIKLIAEAIIRVTGGRVHTNGHSTRTVYFDHGEAEIWSGGDITLRLSSLSPDMAIKLAALATATKQE